MDDAGETVSSSTPVGTRCTTAFSKRAHRRPLLWLGTIVMSCAVFCGLLLSTALGSSGSPAAAADAAGTNAAGTNSAAGANSAAGRVRTDALARGFGPLRSPQAVRLELVALGRALAFDKILSGNRDISCMTCHHPALGTGDARRLSIGTGGAGLGPERGFSSGLLSGRNSPPLYNLHAVDDLFLDGRVSHSGNDYLTPAGTWLTTDMRDVFEFGSLSALALFPVTARDEMRGYGATTAGLNELAGIPSDRPDLIWDALMKRLGAVSEYRDLFLAAYPDTDFYDLSFAHASNAIAGFLVEEFSLSDTPWDRFLTGDLAALTPEQLTGARTFLDLACSECHSGPLLSDHKFHNVALAQFGPGLGDGSGHDDFGRYRVTRVLEDRYAFRTPGLRNIELTAPYGHAGQFADLGDFVTHYSLSADALRSFADGLPPRLSSSKLATADAVLSTRDPLLDGVEFDSVITAQLLDFLGALTDPAALNIEGVVPSRVPSGLSIDTLRPRSQP